MDGLRGGQCVCMVMGRLIADSCRGVEVGDRLLTNDGDVADAVDQCAYQLASVALDVLCTSGE